MFSLNPAKARHERMVLVYSPLWMAVVAWAMFGGAIAHWNDAEFLALGVGLALPPWLMPLVPPVEGERALPWWQRHALRFNVAIAITVFIQSALGTRYFFSPLGMEYHFAARLELEGTPVFLYFLTVAYFSTYYVLFQVGMRALRRALAGVSPLGRLLARAALCYAVAFGETFFMAIDRLKPYFLYRDTHFMLLVGSAFYGSLFFVTSLLFERLDEDPAVPRGPLGRLVGTALVLNTVALAIYQLLSLFITPR